MVDVSAIQPFLDAHKAHIAAFKAVDSRLAAVEGDRDKAISAWMDSADDDTAVQLRAAIEEAQKRLRALAESSVVTEDLSEADKAKLVAERDLNKEKLTAGSRSLRKLIDAFNLEVDADELLKEMGDPTFRKSSSSGAATGSGLPRASVNVTVYKQHEPDTKWQFDNLSKAATHVDLPVEELQKLYAQAGGVDHADIKTIKTDQKFTYQNTAIANSSVWVFETTPKETAPRGRKAVGKDEKKPADPNEITDEKKPAAS